MYRKNFTLVRKKRQRGRKRALSQAKEIMELKYSLQILTSQLQIEIFSTNNCISIATIKSYQGTRVKKAKQTIDKKNDDIKIVSEKEEDLDQFTDGIY